MPTYVYHCRDCRKSFERVRSIREHEGGAPPCPECKGTEVESVLVPFFARTSRKS